ncbi:MAG: PHP domain-containing protein [Desulfurococcales archaeon]|nr:PHP domain-containing protein [Desulfurococcales archaeon]
MTWKIELHSHTTASDGSVSPEELVRIAFKKGLSGLAITDHNTFRGAVLGFRALKIHGFDMMLFYGNEVRTTWGDILVICDHPPSSEAPKDPFELREWSNDGNCIMIAAHPYHLGRNSIGSRVRVHGDLFDAIEVWNARGVPLLNIPAMNDAYRLGKPGVSGSDSHVISEVGVAPIELEWGPSSIDEVIDAIRRGRVKPSIAMPPIRAYIEAAAWAISRRMS